jgi:hypothetical protein
VCSTAFVCSQACVLVRDCALASVPVRVCTYTFERFMLLHVFLSACVHVRVCAFACGGFFALLFVSVRVSTSVRMFLRACVHVRVC